MASMRKTYFLAPSWELRPQDVVLGSVIGDLKAPQRALSSIDVNTHIDTPIPPPIEQKPCSGVAKKSRKWNAGLFATFIQVVTLGGEVSYSSDSTLEVEYSCDLMETHRFTPSSSYIAKIAADRGVQDFLKMGGLGTKAFIITGIKTVHNTTITTTEEKSRETTAQIGIDVPAAQVTVGPKASYASTNHNKHTRTMPEPIVFAIQVEKIRFNRKGKLVSSEYVDGAMLAGDKEVVNDYVIERAGDELDEDEMDDFGVSQLLGVDDETGEDCSIIVPSDA